MEIQERKARFVDPRSVHPDLDHAEQEIQAEIAGLEARLAVLRVPLRQRMNRNPPIDGRAMIEIPEGSFLMGSTESSDEEPPREIELPCFWIDSVPVTNADYEAFTLATGYETPPPWTSGRFSNRLANHPVTCVSWYDAVAYASWATKRLPSEAEWEKAARGTDGRRFPWGDSFDSTCCNTLEAQIGTTTEVDRYRTGCSPFGVWDLAGNVWEWTADGYSPRHKALRGGSWRDLSFVARCSARYFLGPSERLPYVGFRCVWP